MNECCTPKGQVKRYVDCVGCDRKPKQETLEEAAKKYAKSNQYDLEYYDEGGYQEIEVKSFAEKLVDFTTKWQAERMYSEEEVIDFLQEMNDWSTTFEGRIDIREWFEQFKKKGGDK
jgi:hypothetical protein